MGTKQSQIMYSIPISEKPQNKETQIYRNKLSLPIPIWRPEPHIQTLQDLIKHGKTKYSNYDFVGAYNPQTSQFSYKKYYQVYDEARFIASAILNLELYKEVHEYKNFNLKIIGIYSQNSFQWNITDMACALFGFTSVAIYDTLKGESVSEILQNTSISSIFCTKQTVGNILELQSIYQLSNIILYDKIEDDIVNQIKEKGLHLFFYSELLKYGEVKNTPLPYVKSEDIFTLSYSGASNIKGIKGAILSHKNIVGAVNNNLKLSQLNINEHDIQLCFLPLPHIFQRVINIMCWYSGTKIAFFGGDFAKLKLDLQIIRPTIFISVPVIYNQLYDVIMGQLEKKKGFDKKIINSAIRTKLINLQKNNSLNQIIYDMLVFNKIKKIFGKRVRLCISSQASLKPQIADFFKICLCCPLIQIYGQTEASGIEFITNIKDQSSGHTGGICPSLEFKLVDVPEMNYLSTHIDLEGNIQPQGELYVRGVTLFSGYYKDEEKTKQVINEEGWLISGDICQILRNGALQIIDRKTEIFKLSEGEFIDPKKIENIYLKVRGIKEIFVYGDSFRNHCVAFIFPDQDEIINIANELNIENKEFKYLCENPLIVQYYQQNIIEKGKKEGLKDLEQATSINIESESIKGIFGLNEIQQEERNKLKIYFRNKIEKLYNN